MSKKRKVKEERGIKNKSKKSEREREREGRRRFDVADGGGGGGATNSRSRSKPLVHHRWLSFAYEIQLSTLGRPPTASTPPLAHGRPPVSLDPPHPSFIPPQASTQRRPLRRIEGPKTLHGRHAPLSALGGWSMSHLCLFLRFIAFSSSVAFFIFNVGVSCVASVQFNARLVTFPFVLIVHKINQ